MFYGTNVSNTGKSTIQFPSKNKKNYLILIYDKALVAFIYDENTLHIEQLSNNATTPSVIVNGNYNFTLDGLPWWQDPCVIRFN